MGAVPRLIGLLASAIALGVAGCGASPSGDSKGEAEAACAPSALRAARGPAVPAPTQELRIVVVVRNVSPAACSVGAAPRIVLYSPRRVELPFRYSAGPRPSRARLTIAAHGRVLLAVSKPPCTLHATAIATSLGVVLARHTVLPVRLPRAGAFDYCGLKDPTGHVVHVLSLERTLRALLAGP